MLGAPCAEHASLTRTQHIRKPRAPEWMAAKWLCRRVARSVPPAHADGLDTAWRGGYTGSNFNRITSGIDQEKYANGRHSPSEPERWEPALERRGMALRAATQAMRVVRARRVCRAPPVSEAEHR